MATEVLAFEEATRKFFHDIEDVAATYWAEIGRENFLSFDAELVDEVDKLYCRVELACDALREALCARQRQAASPWPREVFCHASRESR